MVNYNLGKIYKLSSLKTNSIYVGSTAQYYLSDRLSSHVNDFGKWLDGYQYTSSFEMIKYGDTIITLLESYPCESKAELNAKEREWLLKLREEGLVCVNSQIPQGIQASSREEWLAKYREQNKEKRSAYNAQYAKDHAERIKTIVKCDCGASFQFMEKARHKKSKKHQTYLSKQVSVEK